LVAVAFYVPTAYHTLYGRFFRDPNYVVEVDREYSNYLWQRLFAFSNLQAGIVVKSVRVDPAEFASYLTENGLTLERLRENEVSREIASFSMTLPSPNSPIIEVLQSLPDPLPPASLHGHIATLTPLPEVRREDVPTDSAVAATLVIDAGERGVIGRYLVWADGAFPVSACVRAPEDQCARIPTMLITHSAQPVVLHLCSCCKLPTVVCPNEEAGID